MKNQPKEFAYPDEAIEIVNKFLLRHSSLPPNCDVCTDTKFEKSTKRVDDTLNSKADKFKNS